jgi:hypothetical protein
MLRTHVFLTQKRLIIHVRVGSIEDHRFIFFVSVCLQNHSMQIEVNVATEDGLQYIQCVLMVTRVFCDISFDPEQNQ